MKPLAYLRHSDIDPERWDAAITRARNGMVYARSWYLDLVSPGWDALVAGDYETVMPLTWRRKAGISYLCQPAFTQQLGVFSERKLAGKDIDAFLKSIPPAFRYIDIFLNRENPHAPEATTARVFRRLTHHLDLPSDPGLLPRHYSENLRRNLKKAEVHAGQVQVIHLAELVALFRRNRGRNIETLGNKEFTLLKHLIAAAQERKLVTLTGIRNGKELLAGACFLESDREYIFFFSATGDEGKKTGAMSALIDQFLRMHCGEGKRLDFEGSMDANLSRYYKSFGASEIVYLHIQSNRLPPCCVG